MVRNGFPDDLVQMQSDWLRTYEELARRSPMASTTALRRRLILLSCQLAGHPEFDGVPAGEIGAARADQP